MFDYDHCPKTLRGRHLLAKERRDDRWRIVYEDCKFEDIYWWGQLITELESHAEMLGIELVLRDKDHIRFADSPSMYETQALRWTPEQKITLCLLRTTLRRITARNVRLIITFLFPELANTTQLELEWRFSAKEKVEGYPVIMAKIHASAKALYKPSE
ncbi:hypothetical protein GP486_004606 [Trichoglossum hirsutum]|uniref:Uncharacterized protein n=1 Tax=Trichoglossum hirsutum TaxID=265104 RepID=A0A9P8LAV1_9PEZI|nr:hypothetical protein GP486_004606 [Trichoglossum hirsutum]